MHKSNRAWLLLLPLACSSLALAGLCFGTAPAQENGKEKAVRAEKVIVQYRVARDATFHSQFVVYRNGALESPVELIWDLLKDKQRKEFAGLIKSLEDRTINGVEFECRGEWLKKENKLRLTSVPQPTDAGKKRIKESED
jgi:hypothetical protein